MLFCYFSADQQRVSRLNEPRILLSGMLVINYFKRPQLHLTFSRSCIWHIWYMASSPGLYLELPSSIKKATITLSQTEDPSVLSLDGSQALSLCVAVRIDNSNTFPAWVGSPALASPPTRRGESKGGSWKWLCHMGNYWTLTSERTHKRPHYLQQQHGSRLRRCVCQLGNLQIVSVIRRSPLSGYIQEQQLILEFNSTMTLGGPILLQMHTQNIDIMKTSII